MRIYITGGTGFVGSNLARKLLQMNDEVAILKREQSSLQYIDDIKDDIKFYDYEYSYSSIDQSLYDFLPEIVIHLASYYTYDHNVNEIDSLLESNIRLGLYLIESLSNNGITKLINTGTSFEHFQNENYKPVNIYAATKHAFQNLIYYYTDSKKLSSITLKLFDTYGPGDKRKKLIWLLKNSVINQKELKLSSGEQVLDLVHINDVVGAYQTAIKLMENAEIGFNEKYGVSGKDRVTLKELVRMVENITEANINAKFGALPYRNREVMKPWDNFRKLPGWEPEYSLFNGLKEIF